MANKIKFFCFSDVHSHYTYLKKALDDAGFDPNNTNHWAISCGDELDRGDESKEVVEFLLSLPRKIIVRGNHTDLVFDCIKRGFPLYHDYSNGTVKTIADISGIKSLEDFKKGCDIVAKKIQPLTDIMVDYFETKNYVFTHSTLPIRKDGLLDPNWRRASAKRWSDARWGNPFHSAEQGIVPKNKKLVFGHWHTSRAWSELKDTPEHGKGAIYDIFETDKYIGLDACTVLSKKVNVKIIEDEFIEKGN